MYIKDQERVCLYTSDGCGDDYHEGLEQATPFGNITICEKNAPDGSGGSTGNDDGNAACLEKDDYGCTQCIDVLFLYAMECHKECPPGWFSQRASSGKECVALSEHEITDNDSTTCDSTS